MSVVFTGTFSGTFTSTGNAQFIPLPSGVDYMWIKNQTVSNASGAGSVAEAYWQLGMPQGQGTQYIKESTIGALVPGQFAANTGFFLQNTTNTTPGALVALTGITNGTPPVVNTASTAGLITGSIVRIYSTVGAQQFGGMDFTVNNVVSNTSFDLAYGPTIANANPGAGNYAIIPFNPYFYPNLRYITNISQAQQAIVTLSVAHTLQVGQKIRFTVPYVTASRYGMTQLNGLEATIVAVGQADANGYTNTITVDTNTTSFTAFSFPITTDPDFTPAFITPFGENTAQALTSMTNILADAIMNTGQIGMLLMGGAAGPAGVSGNTIYWVAGKSFNQ